MMRFIYAALIGALVVLVVLFSVQNVSTVTISFLTVSARLPLALLVILVYASGIFTGGFVLALVRSWIKGARRT
jgi:uncharacterized integral membrane protein